MHSRTSSGCVRSVGQIAALMLALMALSWVGASCHSGQKVRRGKVDDPELVEGKSADDSATQRGGTAEFDRSDDGVVSDDTADPTDSGDTIDTNEAMTSSFATDRGVSPGGRDMASFTDTNLGAGQSAKATGICATGDWGACFREARGFVLADPEKAISLYEIACQPGSEDGDGIACYAAALLASKAGDVARSEQLREAACTKSRFPVLSACGKAF